MQPEYRDGEAVQFYDNGWRYGHVVNAPVRGRHAGMVQVEHPIKGKTWVAGADVRKLDPVA